MLRISFNKFLLLLCLGCMNKLLSQKDTILPVPITEIVREEGVGYRGYDRIPEPSLSGRYWTHKHEKYFDNFEDIKADSGNVLGLYLSCSGGVEIPSEIERFINLKRLEIYYSDGMLQIPTEVWQLSQLESVIIQCYDTTLVLSDSIGELSTLKRLEIRGDLTRIPASIGQLKNLEELFLYSAIFSEVPPEIGKLTNLKTLVLRSMELTELPPSIGNLTMLRKLQIESKLTTLPPEIGKLEQLEEFQLWNTKLETLPPEFGQLLHLRSLDLRSPVLHALPREFGNLSELIDLRIEGTQLTSLPDEICQLTKLRTLNLEYNRLTALPREIGKMASLIDLDVSDNQLTTLPSSIGDLSNLQELDLMLNPLTSVPPEITRLNPLTSVNIERERLIKIPDSVWRFINHNGCYISKVPKTIAGKNLSYYLNQPSIHPTAKLFVSGKWSIMYDRMTYDFLEMLDTIPDQDKGFYVFVINAIVESKAIERGTTIYNYYPYSEIQEICSSLLVQRPCTFFRDIKYGAYKSSYENWIQVIGSLHNDYNYEKTMSEIRAKLNICGKTYLKEVDEVIAPFFYSEK